MGRHSTPGDAGYDDDDGRQPPERSVGEVLTEALPAVTGAFVGAVLGAVLLGLVLELLM